MRRRDITANQVRALLDEGLSKAEVADELDTSLDLIYRRLREGEPSRTVAPSLAAELPKGGVPVWVSTAPCGEDPDLFFPKYANQASPAVQMCRSCAHRLPCLAWAMADDIQEGIWGGLTERERRKLKRSA